jgi:cytoskeletal protein RodZ
VRSAGRHGVSIGEALADARRDAGLTVTEVSYQARIREIIITHIEDDDYSVCGGDSYARGYIRLIAGALRADPEPLIRQYNTTIADDVSPGHTAQATPAQLARRAGVGRYRRVRPPCGLAPGDDGRGEHSAKVTG